MNRKKDFIKNLIILGFGTIFPKLTNFITLPIITAGLSHEEYGLYDLVVTLISLFVPVVTIQIQSAAFRFLIDSREDKEKSLKIISNIVVFVLITSSLSSIFLFLVLIKYDSIIRILIVLYFFSDALLRALQQVIRGMGKNKIFSTGAVVESLFNLLIIIASISYGKMGLIGALVSVAFADVISVVYLIISSGVTKYVKLSCFDKKIIKELINYSWPMVPNSISSWILKSSDRMIISAFLGVGANAIYAVATKIPLMLSVIQNAFTLAWQENASEAQNDENSGLYYSEMFELIFVFLSDALSAIIAATPILFFVLIKGDYDEAYKQIPILFLGMFFYCIMAYFGGIYVAYKKTLSVGITTVVAAIINLLIDLALINVIGIYAASISTLISYMVIVIYRMIDLRKIVDIQYNFFVIIMNLIFVVLMCVFACYRNMKYYIINCVISVFIIFVLNKKMIKKIIKLVLKKRG